MAKTAGRKRTKYRFIWALEQMKLRKKLMRKKWIEERDERDRFYLFYKKNQHKREFIMMGWSDGTAIEWPSAGYTLMVEDYLAEDWTLVD